MFNTYNKRYECLNIKCRDSFSEVSIDRYNQRKEEDKKALDDISKTETTEWFNNQYHDSKKKRWRSAGKPIRTFHWQWWYIVLAFIILSIIVTLILNYLHPGSRFSFFVW